MYYLKIMYFADHKSALAVFVGKMWGKNKQNRHSTTVEWRLV